MPTRYVPLSTFDRLTSSLLGPSGPFGARLDRQIPVDCYRKGDELVLQFDLPGQAEDAVEISLDNRTLTVKASRPYGPGDSDHVVLAERPWGEMSRSVVLGDTLDTERVRAAYDRGVLTVSVPVKAQARSRRIEVTHAPLSATAAEVGEGSEG